MHTTILVDLLRIKILKIKEISLLVFDKYHRCTGISPYMQIMRFCPIKGGPLITGSSASLVNFKKEQKAKNDIKKIKKAMRS